MLSLLSLCLICLAQWTVQAFWLHFHALYRQPFQATQGPSGLATPLCCPPEVPRHTHALDSLTLELCNDLHDSCDMGWYYPVQVLSYGFLALYDTAWGPSGLATPLCCPPEVPRLTHALASLTLE